MLLWDAFNERFGDMNGFLSAKFSDRHDYLTQLERAQAQMAAHRYGLAAHYYQSTTLMLEYVKAVVQQQSLEARVIEAVHRGRVLSREGRRKHTAHLSRISLPGPAKTQGPAEKKDVDQRTQTVSEKVKRTEVEIDDERGNALRSGERNKG